MGMTIYYFSGSGNSLHVAKELKNRVSDANLIPMVSLLRNDSIETNSDIIGFVFPVHLTTVPFPVRIFLDKLELKPEKYIFAITTQGGAPPRLAGIHLHDLLKDKGVKLNAYFNFKMHWSSPVGLMPVYIPGMIEYPKSKEKILRFDSKIQKKLDTISSIIENKSNNPDDDFPRALYFYFKRFISLLMSPSLKGMDKNKILFYADSECNGCEICKNVCLSNKIEMSEGKPVWNDDIQCLYCYACFSFCPKQSVLVKKIYLKKMEDIFTQISHQRTLLCKK